VVMPFDFVAEYVLARPRQFEGMTRSQRAA
jgi:hypothetical protein